jgi:hypothetical protein
MRPEPEHPAAPEQIEHGFDEGLGDRPRHPAQRRVGRFGDRPENRTDDELDRGRFSTGVERDPAATRNRTERRFSQGYPTSTARRASTPTERP